MKRTKLEIAKKNYKPANCIGTAFFIAGVENKDRTIAPESVKNYVGKKLIKTKRPATGEIISFEKNNIPVHMGIITSINPILITHRAGTYHPSFDENAAVYENETRNKLRERYDPNYKLKEVFYKVKK